MVLRSNDWNLEIGPIQKNTSTGHPLMHLMRGYSISQFNSQNFPEIIIINYTSDHMPLSLYVIPILLAGYKWTLAVDLECGI